MCALSAQQALRADALGVGSRATALERDSIMTGGATANIVGQFGHAASRHMRECAACSRASYCPHHVHGAVRLGVRARRCAGSCKNHALRPVGGFDWNGPRTERCVHAVDFHVRWTGVHQIVALTDKSNAAQNRSRRYRMCL